MSDADRSVEIEVLRYRPEQEDAPVWQRYTVPYSDDLSVLHRLLAALVSPYDARAEMAHYQEPPSDDSNYRTFCGT